MKTIFAILIGITLLLVGCSKKSLTLDENTSMKALLKASDEEITELGYEGSQRKNGSIRK